VTRPRIGKRYNRDMIYGTEINKRLDDFIREQEAAASKSLQESPFGLSREGHYVNSWLMNYQRIGFYGTSYVTRDFGEESCVQITVPPTGSGVMPSEREQQPFGWTGRINEYSAELALWWAFELLSDHEARIFMAEHRPGVIFRYFDGLGFRELDAAFNGTIWIAGSIL
jgi:hypothetical protein